MLRRDRIRGNRDQPFALVLIGPPPAASLPLPGKLWLSGIENAIAHALPVTPAFVAQRTKLGALRRILAEKIPQRQRLPEHARAEQNLVVDVDLQQPASQPDRDLVIMRHID